MSNSVDAQSSRADKEAWMCRVGIAPLTRRSLLAYEFDGQPTGDFLHAVLLNNFIGAVARADDVNIHSLRAIAQYVHNIMPGNIHGTAESLQNHIKKKEQERRDRTRRNIPERI